LRHGLTLEFPFFLIVLLLPKRGLELTCSKQKRARYPEVLPHAKFKGHHY